MSRRRRPAAKAVPEPPVVDATPQQAMAELEATLSRLGLVPFIVARGNVTGKVAPIEDFMPPTHTAIIQFQKAQ